MLADYQKIIQILKTSTTQQVRQSEQEIQRLAAQDLQILSCLRQCLQDPTLDHALKVIAASHINSLFVNNISEYTQQFCITYFTNLLHEQKISIRYKKQLSRSIMYCLQQSDSEYLQKWKQLFYNTLFNKPRSLYLVALILISAFSCSEVRNNLIEEIDEKVFDFLMGILDNSLVILVNIVTQQNLNKYKDDEDMDGEAGFSNNQIQSQMGKSNQTHSKQYLTQLTQQITYNLQAWKTVIEYLKHFFNQLCTKTFYKWSNCQNFINCLNHITKNLSTGNNTHFMYLGEFLQEEINEIKQLALEIHVQLFDQIVQKSRKVSSTKLYQFTGLNVEIFVNTLCFATYSSSFRDDNDFDEILVIMMKIIKCLYRQTPQLLYKSWKPLLHYIVFPYLAINNQQLQDFEENLNSFIQINEDCCQKQKMGLLKSQAAQFMERIADMSDAIQKFQNTSMLKLDHLYQRKTNIKNQQAYVVKYIFNFAIACIKHHLQMQNINNCQFFQTYLNELPQSISIISVETAFMVMTVFSYCIEYYPKEIEQIKTILCDDRVKNLPPLERARIYVFLAYNHDQVFGLGHIQNLKYWKSLALKENDHPAVTYCALDFISNSLCKFYDQSQIQQILQKIKTTKSNNFWLLLRKLVSLYLYKFSQNLLVSLINQCYARIDNQQVKITYIITQLLFIIRVISQKGEYIFQRPKVRSLLWRVTSLYGIAVANYFDDDIIKIINCFLFYASKEEVQHLQMRKFLGDFTREFAKAGYEPTCYYIAFNNYVMKSNCIDGIIMPIYKVMKESLIYFLGSESMDNIGTVSKNSINSNLKKLPISHTLLVLQNIVAINGNNLPTKQLQSLSQVAKALYPKIYTPNPTPSNPTPRKKVVIYERALLAKALNLQLLCYIYEPDINTIETLTKYHKLRIYYGYDVGVALDCLKILIRRELNLEMLSKFIEFCINIVYVYMEIDNQHKIQSVNQQQKQIQQKQHQIPISYHNKHLFDDQSSQNKIDQQGLGNSKQQSHSSQAIKAHKSSLIIRIKKISDYEAILAYTNTPFLKQQQKMFSFSKNVKSVMDIRQEFVNMIVQLRQSNDALMESIIGGFDGDVTHRLETVVEYKVQQILEGKVGLDRLGSQKLMRKKYVVIRPKQGYIQQHENNTSKLYNQQKLTQYLQDHDQTIKRRQNIKIGDDELCDQQDREMLKRQKAEKKRRAKNAKESNDEKEQINKE